MFQPGNKEQLKGNRQKPKIITQNLIAELKDAEGTKLRRVVQALIARAIEGDVQAIREVMDRVDGKVPQGIAGDDELPPIKQVLELRWKSSSTPST